jgi:myo-inositol 2-dehydrogenase / D-chiro-inositol 1-dehydrogenase
MMTTTKRRDFIRASAAAAAASTMTFPALVRGQNLNSEIKVGLVGGGGRGTGAADQNLTVTDLPTRLVAIGDVVESQINGALNQLTGKHGAKIAVDGNKHVGPDAFLKVIEKSDLVILATPPGFRPMMFAAAVAAGKHVFTEKPVCVDSPGYRTFIEAAKQADAKNLKVVVGLQRRYQTKYREVMKRIQAGEIGKVVAAQVYWNGDRPWVRDHQPNDTELQYQMRNWYHFAWLSGDNICEQHIHNLDIAAWALGDTAPKLARGMGGRQVLTDKKYGEIFDHHAVEYIWDNDVYVNSQSEHTPNTWSRVSEAIICTGGIAYPDSGTIKDHAGKTLFRHKDDGDPNPYQVEHNELYAAIKNNTPHNDAHRGANSSMIAVLGRYATYSGKEIKWADAITWDNSQMVPDFAKGDFSKGFQSESSVKPNADGTYTVPIPGKFNAQTHSNG